MIGTPTAVKFFHPGEEWSASQYQDQGIACWNTKKHRRKYLQTSGTLLSRLEDPAKAGTLGFWGEYEAPTEFRKLAHGPQEGLPRFVHTPLPPYPSLCPGVEALNTDPLVLSPRWLYTNCLQQIRPKLRHLERGDVILFGSRLEMQFVIDTVFVVDEAIIYSPATARSRLGDRVPWWVYPLVLDLIAPGQYVLYFGASHQNPVNRTFSYVPCVEANAYPDGFARPKAPPAYQSAQNQSVQYLGNSQQVWREVTQGILEQGLLLGVSTEVSGEFASSVSSAPTAKLLAGNGSLGPTGCGVSPSRTGCGPTVSRTPAWVPPQIRRRSRTGR